MLENMKEQRRGQRNRNVADSSECEGFHSAKEVKMHQKITQSDHVQSKLVEKQIEQMLIG